MRAELYLALRFLWGKRRESLVFFMSIVSIVGIALGVGTLIVVLSVMSGFDEKIKEKILGTDFHISLQIDDTSFIDNIKKEIFNLENVKSLALYADTQMFLASKDRVYPLWVRGLEAEFLVNFRKYLLKGVFPSSSGEVLLGKEIPSSFFINIGDKIPLLTLEGKKIEVKVTGLIDTGLYDVDSRLVLADLGLLQELRNQTLWLGIKLKDIERVDYTAEMIRNVFPHFFLITWAEKNRSLFEALKLEKIIMFFLLGMVILVASFSIISLLMVKVFQKTRDIGILKSLGFGSSRIMRLFLIEGFILGILGVVAGLILGASISFLIENYHIIKLPKDIYYIDYLPARLNPGDLFSVGLFALFLIFCASIYPAIRARVIEPSISLRYE